MKKRCSEEQIIGFLKEADGKARSAMNAWKHGARSAAVLAATKALRQKEILVF